ncbi:hypothetical protein CASFOL_020865 [Castilleja foliolosa]|uniref:CCHC-type domain-containing protein n=1 Tax=Castilleja foliolosa TaxID=1961234 RepID=A0ABD3D2V7_9LAMI
MERMTAALLFGNISDVKLDIPELKSENYKVWKERVLLQLRWMDIDYAIRNEEPPSITETSSPDAVDLYEKWERSNRLSIMFVKSKICASTRDSIDQYTKVRDLLEAIDKQFAISDEALVRTLFMKLSSMRHTGSEGVRDYIVHMVDIAAKLKDLDVSISETFVVQQILFSLPPQYESFYNFYNTHKCKWSIHELMTMCVKEEERLRMKEDEKVKLAATSSSSKKKNGNGKVSAYQRMKKQFRCFFCKKKGHVKKECIKFKAWLERKGYEKPKESNEEMNTSFIG